MKKPTAALLAFAAFAVPLAITPIIATPSASADICAGAGGRHFSASGCTNIAGDIATVAASQSAYRPGNRSISVRSSPRSRSGRPRSTPSTSSCHGFSFPAPIRYRSMTFSRKTSTPRCPAPANRSRRSTMPRGAQMHYSHEPIPPIQLQRQHEQRNRLGNHHACAAR